MKKAILLVGTFVLILLACTTEKKQSFLTTDNIRIQTFNIDPAKENRIVGARGGIFTIPAGAFEGTATVIIELKEVYAPIEILAAGLTTESNGELLESGGMFYMNAKRDGKELELKKKINGSIPTNYMNDSMRLFKGEVTEDGDVNWVDPAALNVDSSKNKECIEQGQLLFFYNCASCHAVSKKITGPELAGADRRITKEMYYDFIANPSQAALKYPYFQNRIKQYGVMMTAFPALEREAIDCIIEFVKAAEKDPLLEIMPDSIRNKIWKTDSISNPINPCGYDTVYINSSLSSIDSNLFSKPDSLNETILPDTTVVIEASDLEGLRNGFTDRVSSYKGRYDFTISTLGWYNIDAYVKGLPGTTNIDLLIDTDFEEEQILDIHVFMPSKKLLSVAQYNIGDGLFHFEKVEGKAPFFLNDEAIAIAITSKEDESYYGITKFKVTQSQQILIKIKKVTPEEIKKAFKKANLDGIDLDYIVKEKVINKIPCDKKPITDTTKYLK